MKINEINKVHTPYELFGTEGLDDKSGWAGLVRMFLHTINDYNKDKPDDEKLTITQIKEKWGSLCLYTHGLPNDIYDYREMLEEASNHICEHCGSPFHVGKYTNGWIETVCKDCAKKEDKYGFLYEYTYSYGKKGTKEYRTFNILLKEKNKNEAWSKLYDKSKEYIKDINKIKLLSIDKIYLWDEHYHSVRIDWLIRMALKLQKICNKIGNIFEKIRFKVWYIIFKIKIRYGNKSN